MHYTPPAIKQNVTLVRDLCNGCDFRTINPHSLKTHKKINHDEDTILLVIFVFMLKLDMLVISVTSKQQGVLI